MSIFLPQLGASSDPQNQTKLPMIDLKKKITD